MFIYIASLFEKGINLKRLATMFLLLFAIVGFAQHNSTQHRPTVIPAIHHRPNISNHTGGYCVWASTTTWARHYGHQVDLVRERQITVGRGPSWMYEASKVLKEKRIPHVFHPIGTRKVVFPSVVTISYTPRESHAVIWIGNDGVRCSYHNPNHPGKVLTLPSTEFRRRWYGDAIHR